MSRFEQAGQDWDSIVVGKGRGKGRGGGGGGGGSGYTGPKPGDSRFVTRPGMHQSASGATMNQQHRAGGGGVSQKKLADDTETLKHKHTTLELRIHLQQARTAKGWTQKDFAQQIQERDTTVKEYESGKAIPNGQLISKMERALGVHLRGQDAGKPLVKKEPKKPAAKPGGKAGRK
eukprot:TRINITY_DN1760_c0_g1_i1.p1 TRINITY_DN1760_c0_g1~~TRINITY_DN1760_c0_g1_i1.p1  ORF type:complete len:176 (+),score=57.87 TRINITY_DN1760_c0_g1_i1:71-598(+)